MECRFTLRCVRDMIRTCSKMDSIDKYLQELNHLVNLAKWLSVHL